MNNTNKTLNKIKSSNNFQALSGSAFLRFLLASVARFEQEKLLEK